MKKFDWEPVKDFAGLVGGFLSYGILVVAARKTMELATESSSSTIARYADAVGAIMDSSIWSHDKAKAVTALKRHGDSEFYKSIIYIVKDSSMFSHDKVDMIETLSQK